MQIPQAKAILIAAILLGALRTTCFAVGYLPVFPGAQGFGTETPAGRGGKIIKVTNLDDDGRGSLRAAINASGPRIVVFEVSGNIVLTENLKINYPFITIAGQTAPSPGITLTGAGVQIKTHDVLMQHLRIRVGSDLKGPPPEKRDGCTVYGPSGYNVVLDHLSISWAVDKNTSTWYRGVRDVTLSNSIISEALRKSINPQGEHSMGSLVGDHAKRVSFVGNLWAHNKGRNPAMKGETSSVVLNNLIYNPGYWTMYLADDFDHGPILTSIVGNVVVTGPNTPANAKILEIRPNIKKGTKVFFWDNLCPGLISSNKAGFEPWNFSPPEWHPSFRVYQSSSVKSRVLANAGARPGDRDPVDKRIVREVTNRGGGIIDSPEQVGGLPALPMNVRRFKLPVNPNGDDDGDGYTNIEEVLHEMAAHVEGRR